MTGLASRPLKLIRRFARESRGATAVEFAFISIPLMLLMFGVLELCMILLVSATLDMATDFAARNIRTGVFQKSGGTTKVDFEKMVCRNMNWLESMCQINAEGVSPGKLYVETETFANFTSAGALPARDPVLFEPEETAWCPGNPEDIVVVRTYFKWPIVSPMLKPLFENYAGGRLITTTRLFRNEPFDPSLQKKGNATSCGY